ncbi:MAG: amidohydrolase [Clostridiales bacterium]|nr:amidohydrolase [Clostridiales bacterium]
MMTIREQAFAGKPLDTFTIDCHTHLTQYFKSGWHQNPKFWSLESLIEVYDSLGVDCCVTAPHAIIDSMTVEANEVAEEAAKLFPGRIYGYISVAPFEGLDVLKSNLKRFASNPAFVGMKFLGGYNGDYTDPIYRYATDFAEEARCPILCHSWGNMPSHDTLRDMALTHPNMKLICAHQGGGNAALTDSIAKVVAECPNLYVETCGSLYNQYGIEDIVRLCGEDRVVFGTDAINLDARFDFGRVALAPLEDEVMAKVLSGNFLNLLETSQMGKIKV